MVAKLPVLGGDAQTRIVQLLSEAALYPVVFQWNSLVTNALFPNVDPAGFGRYATYSYTPTNSLGIMHMQVNNVPISCLEFLGVIVSFSPIVSLAHQLSGSNAPGDYGNHIYRAFHLGSAALVDDVSLKPNTYYIDPGRTLYIHRFATTATLASVGAASVGQVILHTIQTGVRA